MKHIKLAENIIVSERFGRKPKLKNIYGIVWAFKQGDNIFDIAWYLGKDKRFVEEIIREYMNGEIK